MIIERYKQEVTDEVMELLLTADPNKEEVLSYISDAKILVARDKGLLVGIGVLLVTGECAVLKNLAIAEKYQGKGIAKLMVRELKTLGRVIGANYMEVGTGNSSLHQLALYQKCGFRMKTIIPNYFKSYPDPIYENGIQCIDMVQLSVKL